MRIGMGQLVTSQGPMSGGTAETDSTTYVCGFWESIFEPASMCASAASAVGPFPNLTTTPQYPVTITYGAPQPGAGSSVASGTTADGQTIYINQPSAQDQQAANVASIAAQAAASTPPDCTQLWNQLTSPACPCTYCTSYGSYVAIGLGVILLIWAVNKL